MSKKGVSVLQIKETGSKEKFREQIKTGDILLLYLSKHVDFIGIVDTVVKDSRKARFNLTSLKASGGRTSFGWQDVDALYGLVVVERGEGDTSTKEDFSKQKNLNLTDEDKGYIRDGLNCGSPVKIVLLKPKTRVRTTTSLGGVRIRRER